MIPTSFFKTPANAIPESTNSDDTMQPMNFNDFGVVIFFMVMLVPAILGIIFLCMKEHRTCCCKKQKNEEHNKLLTNKNDSISINVPTTTPRPGL